MLHARDDYNRIQDPENKIGENEPVMLFRAQDKHFISVLVHYRDCIANDPNADHAIIEKVNNHIKLASKWPNTKSPDL